MKQRNDNWHRRLPPAARRRAERERQEAVQAALDRPLIAAELAEFEEEIAKAVDDEDYDDDTRSYVEVDEVIGLLRNIERYRGALARDTATLQRWLDGSSELQELWSKFMRCGGVTADDFRQFIDGRFRDRRIRQRRHLRLVSSKASVVRRYYHSRDGDAA
jgi:hypothetical protein